MADEDTISYTEIFDLVSVRVDIKLDLEVSTPMLLCRLLVFVWDDEIVYDAFLTINISIKR